MQAFLIGILSSLFFSATFLVNRAMNLSGTSWAWTGALRFLIALPFLFAIVAFRRNLKPLFQEMRLHPFAWILWGTVAGAGFYSLLSFSAVYGPSWLVAGTWQVTILAGSLLAPLFFTEVQTESGLKKVRNQIPFRSMKFSAILFVGVVIMQLKEAGSLSLSSFLLGFVPVVVAAFLYPLGNRKLMVLSAGRLDTFQRVLGMTISSVPLCLVLSLFGWQTTGLPSGSQMVNALLLALCSGVIAGVLFFYATDLVKDNLPLLAMVESTQSGTMVFTVLGEVLLLGGSMPTGWALVGMLIIMVGMILNSLVAGRQTVAKRM